MNEPRPVVIVGAGLAGLCCALKLQANNVPFVILEASDRIGGRVGTDYLGGFQLDRGFQLFYTAYPEAKSILNYDALQLHKLANTVLVCFGGRLHKASDPFRDPITAIPNPFSPIGTVPDKVKASLLRQQIVSKSLKDIFEEKDAQTKAALHNHQFSENIINRFFQPYFSTVFLEKDLRTSSKMFEFMFNMIANGSITLPAKGMQAIPDQLASKLPAERIITQVRVAAVSDYYLRLDTGDEIDAAAVVVATDGPDASLLLRDLPKPRTHAVTTVYFEAPTPPQSTNLLSFSMERVLGVSTAFVFQA